jgi:hypothetical protein
METPDRWMLVKVDADKPFWKIFATWSGGYLYGDSWRLNSGVAEVKDEGNYYLFVSESGSVYKCNKFMYGTTVHGSGVIKDLVVQTEGKFEPLFEEPKDIMKLLENV